jgi:multidrug efflux pump
VIVNRDKAMDTGVQIETVGRTLETMLGGRQVTRFKREGEQYDVIVQVADSDRATPSPTSRHLRPRQGRQHDPAGQPAAVDETVSPRELNHFGQRRAVTITANLTPGYAMGEALQFLETTAGRVLPPGYAVDYAGQSREFKLSSSSLALTFTLALAFIYLVLAAQFESFRDPFIIMLTVPLSMTGALLALLLSGGTLNVYSQIGLVTLVGLITKHGILIVEFANQLQERGQRDQAGGDRGFAVLRLRPILMTTGAMVLGTIPLALARGAGAESRQQIGWVIVGGLLLGTLFTLFVVPTVYTLLAWLTGVCFAANDQGFAGHPSGQTLTVFRHPGPAAASGRGEIRESPERLWYPVRLARSSRPPGDATHEPRESGFWFLHRTGRDAQLRLLHRRH